MDRKTIKRVELQAENLRVARGVELKKRKQPKVRFPLRIRFKALTRQIWRKTKRPLFYALSLTKYRYLLTLMNIDMSIKINQTSTKAGIVLLASVLSMLGFTIDPNFLSDNVEQLVQGVIMIVGSVTAIYSIFKDDDKNPEDKPLP